MRTIVFALLASLGFSHAAGATGALHQVFAGCVGRYSAEMEHAWLLGDAAADDFEAKRHSFLSLMEATMPPGTGRAVLAHRLDHKFAHAALLSLATFGQDSRRAEAAKIAARGFRLHCDQLLLGG